MNRLDFSYNWNNKLECKAFTTFRMANPHKYKIGLELEVYLKDKFVAVCKIIDMRVLRLDQVNEFVAYLDTGYSVDEFKNIVRRMYKEKADSADFVLVLLEKMKVEK